MSTYCLQVRASNTLFGLLSSESSLPDLSIAQLIQCSIVALVLCGGASPNSRLCTFAPKLSNVAVRSRNFEVGLSKWTSPAHNRQLATPSTSFHTTFDRVDD